ncbi:hypothetical protein EJ04DRAFT_550098 [Polyplosphaeria fusca]|uniref:Uncharacterized protein n=1 Tax=Polyplosphaeria fusca TaxID=682080 RepID=A0A9P4V4T8_9PLEO|nr:hypothetical protein EJ04DRAFT_550098 [Polyplosphaeria fusca]
MSNNAGQKKFNWRYWPSDPLPYASSLDAPEFFSFHPELDDELLIAWGLAVSQKDKEARANIDVLVSREDKTPTWHVKVSDAQLQKIVSEISDERPSASSFQAFFIDTRHSKRGWLPGNFTLSPNSVRSLRQAGLSSLILTSMYTSFAGWAKMGNQHTPLYDKDGNLNSFAITYSYVWGWDTGRCYTQFIRTRETCTYFCINYPSRAFERLKRYLNHDPKLIRKDFFLDTLAAADTIHAWHGLLSERREPLFSHERSYEEEHVNIANAPRELHRLARDLHTLRREWDDESIVLDFLLTSCSDYKAQLSSNGWITREVQASQESLKTLKSQCDHGANWTRIYHDRTNIRIDLMFHLAGQREARNSTQIAISTAQTAERTRLDSASMITIAAVTMFFLPGTFVSAILSTTFFDYGEAGLKVSSQWWILPAVTLPLTVIVFAVWFGWRHWRVEKTAEFGLEEKKIK